MHCDSSTCGFLRQHCNGSDVVDRTSLWQNSPAVRDLSLTNFGLIIAYLLPGFTALWGVSYFSETVRLWIHGSPADSPTVGGFLYVTMASIAAGLTASTIRWAIIDSIHHRTGIHPPQWDFSLLQRNVDAFGVLVEIHYKYYQFYGNMLIALTFTYCARRWSLGFLQAPVNGYDFAFLFLHSIFFLGSRDSLRKYYQRTAHFLETVNGSQKQSKSP